MAMVRTVSVWNQVELRSVILLLFIVPCMIGATLFPYVLCDGILKRQWHLLKRYIIVLLPSVFWMLLSHLV